MIHPDIWESEDFSKLSSLAKLVFIGMFSLADDEGKGRAKPVYLKSIIFPYDDGMRIIDIEKALSEIGHNMSVTFYAHDGNAYYMMDNWSKWQRVDKPQPSKIPNPCTVENGSGMILESVENGSGLREVKGREEKEEEIESGADAPPPPDHEDKKPEKLKCGKYGWVRLTQEEGHRLKEEYGEDIVKHYIYLVDERAQSTGNKNKWKDWNLVVRRAIREKWGAGSNGSLPPASKNSYEGYRKLGDL